MKQLLCFSTLVFTLFTNSVAALEHDCCIAYPKAYLGLEAKCLHMNFSKEFGDNLFHRNSFDGNMYLGLRLNKFLGVELGYESTNLRYRTTTLTTGDVVTGMPIPDAASPVVFRSRIKTMGPHLDLLGFYPLCNDRFELLAAIGLSNLRGSAERCTVSINTHPANYKRTFSERKTLLRIMGGAQFSPLDRFWIRTTLGWMDTKKLIMHPDDGGSGQFLLEIKPRASVTLGLGAFITF